MTAAAQSSPSDFPFAPETVFSEEELQALRLGSSVAGYLELYASCHRKFGVGGCGLWLLCITWFSAAIGAGADWIGLSLPVWVLILFYMGRSFLPCHHGKHLAHRNPKKCSKCVQEVTFFYRTQRMREETKLLQREAAQAAERLRAAHQLGQMEFGSQLADLDPFDFERVVCDVYRRLGYEVEGTPKTGDGGVDGYLKRDGKVYLLQCKRVKGSVGQPILRDLYGVMRATDAQGGIVVTTGRVSRQAREWAKGKDISLVETLELKGLIRHVVETELQTHQSGSELSIEPAPARASQQIFRHLLAQGGSSTEVPVNIKWLKEQWKLLPEFFAKRAGGAVEDGSTSTSGTLGLLLERFLQYQCDAVRERFLAAAKREIYDPADWSGWARAPRYALLKVAKQLESTSDAIRKEVERAVDAGSIFLLLKEIALQREMLAESGSFADKALSADEVKPLKQLLLTLIHDWGTSLEESSITVSGQVGANSRVAIRVPGAPRSTKAVIAEIERHWPSVVPKP